MPIQVNWDTQFDNVIMYMIKGAWTWDDMLAAFQTELKLIKTIDGKPYHTIIDMRNAMVLPDTNTGISQLNKIYQQKPSNNILTIFVTQNEFILIFLKLFMRLNPRTKQDMSIQKYMKTAYQRVVQHMDAV